MITPLMRKMFEHGPQNQSKIDPKMLQNRLQKGAEAKNRKSVKTNNVNKSFILLIIIPLIRKMIEPGPQNHFKIEPKMLQNRLQKGAKGKNSKNIKTNNPLTFLYIRDNRKSNKFL